MSVLTPSQLVKPIARPEEPAWLPSDEQLIDRLASHQSIYRFRKPRYQIQLLKDLATLLPAGDCRVLDVGGGSGLVAEMVATTFPGKRVVAVDVVNRVLPSVGVPFHTFDGQNLPFENSSFDCALLCNVLHHVKVGQRYGLLREILRVTGGGPLIIKDHVARTRLDHFRLAWLDLAGNAPFGGMVEAEYLSGTDWDELMRELQCVAEQLPSGPYRGWAYGMLFSNRLETCLRVAAAKTVDMPANA